MAFWSRRECLLEYLRDGGTVDVRLSNGLLHVSENSAGERNDQVVGARLAVLADDQGSE
jgi:hypothetical protein